MTKEELRKLYGIEDWHVRQQAKYTHWQWGSPAGRDDEVWAAAEQHLIDIHERLLRKIAGQMWEAMGKPEGRDLEIWFAAQTLVSSDRHLYDYPPPEGYREPCHCEPPPQPQENDGPNTGGSCYWPMIF